MADKHGIVTTEEKDNIKEIVRPQNKNQQEGFEGTDNSDLSIPRAKCLQALSQEISDSVEGLQQGDIINNITKQKLPKKFTPILFSKSWVRFEDGKVAYITSSEQEAIDHDGAEAWSAKTLNVLALFEGEDFPIVVSFRGSSFKIGKQFLTLAKFKNQAAYNFSYELTTTKEKNDKGTFYVLSVKPSGESDDMTRAMCAEMYRAFKSQNLKVDYSDELVEDKETDEKPY